MTIDEEKTFVENPFDVLKIVLLVQILIVVFVVIMVSIAGPPKSPKAPVKTAEGFVFMMIAINVGIFALVALVLSFFKKRTIVCSTEGLEISGVDAWGTLAPNESFRWRDVTDTNLKLVYIGRGGRQLNLEITSGGKEVRLLTRNLLNRTQFEELMDVVNRSTPHLDYELIRLKDAGDRRVVADFRKYGKAARL